MHGEFHVAEKPNITVYVDSHPARTHNERSGPHKRLVIQLSTVIPGSEMGFREKTSRATANSSMGPIFAAKWN
jgi:hypothetical protein